MNERYLGKAAVIAAFLFTLIFFAQGAHASIDVSPVRLDLSDSQDKDVIHIGNRDETEKSYQVEVVAWSQTDERREVYTPTDALLAVPILFTLQPGEDQLVRVGMLQPADAEVERSYRVFITEIAAPPTDEVESAGIRMRIQVGIPVFVSPSEGLPFATLDYVSSMRVDNNLFVRMRNGGNTHVKVIEIQHSLSDSEEKSVEPALIYILAGQMGYVPVSIPDGTARGTLSIVTENQGTLEYELPLAP
jgi:fimbrial chaperone protein